MKLENLYKLPKILPEEEYNQCIFEDEKIRIERIISSGQVSPWYDQDELEFVSLLKGQAQLEFKSKVIKLEEGDYIMIPPNEKHKVIYTSSEPKCIWLCVFRKYKGRD